MVHQLNQNKNVILFKSYKRSSRAIVSNLQVKNDLSFKLYLNFHAFYEKQDHEVQKRTTCKLRMTHRLNYIKIVTLFISYKSRITSNMNKKSVLFNVVLEKSRIELEKKYLFIRPSCSNLSVL